MKRFHKICLLLGVAAVLAVGYKVTAGDTPAEEVLATVGDRVISVSAFQQVVNAPPACVGKETHEQKEQILQRVVETLLLAMEARDQEIDREEAVQRALQNYEDNLLARLYYERLIDGKVTVSEAEIAAGVQRYMDKMNDLKKIKARHIMLNVAPDADAKDWDQALERAMTLKKQIDEGADFGILAAEHSEDRRTKRKNGYLSDLDLSQKTYGLSTIVLALKEGQVSEPVRGRRGVHIVKVESIPQPVDRLDPAQQERVEQKVKMELMSQKAQELRTQTFERLGKKYGLTMNTDLLTTVQFTGDGECEDCR
jgi:parvulin-like peptidyl-prolyl isomerase